MLYLLLFRRLKAKQERPIPSIERADFVSIRFIAESTTTATPIASGTALSIIFKITLVLFYCNLFPEPAEFL